MTRGPIVECEHAGAIAVVDASGRLVAHAGAPGLVSYLRSTCKPIQALPLIESGAADALTLSRGSTFTSTTKGKDGSTVVFEGKGYEWSRRLEIVAGRDATLALTVDNASLAAVTPASTSATSSETDPSVLASQWQETVVALWTPTQHASGFVVDDRGLIVTNQRVVGTATSVEAQFAPDIRVRATVLASDPVRDIAILRVNPSVVTSLRPLPLGCGQARPTVANRQELYTIGADMRGRKRLALGDVTGVGPRLILSDLRLVPASAGGPVFAAGGLIGFTTVDDRDPDDRSDARVVRIDQACEVMSSVEKKMPASTDFNSTFKPSFSQASFTNACSF